MSLTCYKTKLAISTLSFLCLHNKYIVKGVASSKIIAEINIKMSMIVIIQENFVSIYFCDSIMPFVMYGSAVCK